MQRIETIKSCKRNYTKEHRENIVSYILKFVKVQKES